MAVLGFQTNGGGDSSTSTIVTHELIEKTIQCLEDPLQQVSEKKKIVLFFFVHFHGFMSVNLPLSGTKCFILKTTRPFFCLLKKSVSSLL